MAQIMAWRRPGNKPLSEPMVVSLSKHICVTRPQLVNIMKNIAFLFNHRTNSFIICLFCTCQTFRWGHKWHYNTSPQNKSQLQCHFQFTPNCIISGRPFSWNTLELMSLLPWAGVTFDSWFNPPELMYHLAKNVTKVWQAFQRMGAQLTTLSWTAIGQLIETQWRSICIIQLGHHLLK